MIYANAMLSGYQSLMIDPSPVSRLRRHAAATIAVLGLSCGLGGCASVGDSFASSAFVDPAKYGQFDCKQMETERKTLAARTAEQQRLIDKASTGVGGSVVGEMVYRNEYVSIRASSKLLEETWRDNKCVETPPPAAAVPATPAVAPAAATKSGRKNRPA